MRNHALARFTMLTLGAALALTACGDDGPGAMSTDGGDSDIVESIVEIGSCDPYVGSAEAFLGHPVIVTGTGDPCKFSVREQVELHGAYFWTAVHFETIPVGEEDLPRIIDLISERDLTMQEAPVGWSYAGSAPGELHYVLVDKVGMALHCSASIRPGGGSEGSTPPGIDPVALLVFCDQVRDTAVEQE